MAPTSTSLVCICLLLLSAPLARAACDRSREGEVESYATFARRLMVDSKTSALEKEWAQRGLGPLPAGQNAYFLKQNATTQAEILASLPKGNDIPTGKKPPTAAQTAAAKKAKAKEAARLAALKEKHAVKHKPVRRGLGAAGWAQWAGRGARLLGRAAAAHHLLRFSGQLVQLPGHSAWPSAAVRIVRWPRPA